MPVDGYLELQAHNDALFRELELISIELETDDARVASPLTDLVDQLYRRFRGQRDSYRDVVAAAQGRGQATVELETTVPPAAAGAARSYLALLEQADELCRSGILLTPEPPPTSDAAALVHGADGRPAPGRRHPDPAARIESPSWLPTRSTSRRWRGPGS